MWLKLNEQDLEIDVIPFLVASDENFKATGSLSQHVIKEVIKGEVWVKIGVVDQNLNRNYPISDKEKSFWTSKFSDRSLKKNEEINKIVNSLREF